MNSGGRTTKPNIFNFIITAFLLCFCVEVHAASQSLKTLLSQIQVQLTEIQSEKKKLVQVLTYSADKPHKVSLVATTINLKKGSESVERWDFNLSDIDVRLVNYVTGSTAIVVALKTKDAQKFISSSKDGKKKRYVSDLEITAIDIDSARAIKDFFIKAIPLADTSWNKIIGINFNAYDQMRRKLKDIQVNSQSGSKTLLQEIALVNQVSDKLVVTTTEINSKGKQTLTKQEFSMADLLEQSVVINTGKDLQVLAKTKRDLKVVRLTVNGELKGYSNKIELYANDVDEARIMQRLLVNLVEPAGKALVKRLSVATSKQQLLNAISKHIQPFQNGSDSIDQSLDSKCITSYRLATTKKAGKITEEIAQFNFGDLQENSVEIKVSGKLLSVTSQIKEKQKYVKAFKDGEQKSYTNKISFPVKSVDSAKAVVYIMSKVIDKCAVKPIPQKWTWLVANVAAANVDLPGLTQKMARKTANSQCKVTFSSALAKKNKVAENVYDFNLNDLDEKAVEINISGKKVEVGLQTNYSEKIIKVYDGKKSKYVSDFSLLQSSLGNARNFKATIESMIKKCKS